MSELVTYLNKETGKFEKQNLSTGEIYKAEDFYKPEKRKKYNLDDASKVCAMVRDGYPLAGIAGKNDLPNAETIYFWKKLHPDFAKALEEAREFAAEKFAHKALEIAESAATLHKDAVPAAKLQVDTFKWMAEKMNPDLYGSRTKVTGDKDNPVAIVINTGIQRNIPETKEE